MDDNPYTSPNTLLTNILGARNIDLPENKIKDSLKYKFLLLCKLIKYSLIDVYKKIIKIYTIILFNKLSFNLNFLLNSCH